VRRWGSLHPEFLPVCFLQTVAFVPGSSGLAFRWVVFASSPAAACQLCCPKPLWWTPVEAWLPQPQGRGTK
jgi:hypothetical protein